MSLFFFSIFLIFGLGAVGSLCAAGFDRAANAIGNGAAMCGSLLAFLFAARTLFAGETYRFDIASSFPGLSFSFQVDALSAFFMLVIALVAFACSLYATGYVRHYYGSYNIGTLGFFYNLFIVAMCMVVTAHNALFFLIVWELMSLSSYFLVIYEHRRAENIRAGFLYLVMAHIGTACIAASLLLLYRAAGSFDFDAMRNAAASLPAPWLNAIFLSALIGFGIKSGIIPLHVWLPSAHPAAPSQVSALMSGVMIKTGIYMLMRIFLGILPAPALWWGALVLALGACSSVLGVLYALSEHDLKRLLAYHSIENIGIILLGLGSSLIFLSLGMPAFALLSLVAALFHTLNHALFKALLFLAGGSVVSQMHTRNIEKYGGLIRFMPVTAASFLIGAMAISGLPPFNGFFSEWLTFQALFEGIAHSSTLLALLFVLGAAMLAATSGFAAACFVKAFGATFLARPRSKEVSAARESSRSMQGAMAALAALTLAVGLSAGLITRALAQTARSLPALASAAAFPGTASFASVSTAGGFAALSMPLVCVALLLGIGAAALGATIATGRRRAALGPTWDCGTPLSPRMEITATSFSLSIITVLRDVLRPTRQSAVEYRGGGTLRYFPARSSVHFEVPDLYLAHLYRPLKQTLAYLSASVRRMQAGNINGYILYMFVALLGVLLFCGL